MEKKESPACAILIFLAGLAFVVFAFSMIVQDFRSPEGINSMIHGLMDLAIFVGECLGAVALAFAVTAAFILVSHRLQSRIIKHGKEYLARALPIELEKFTHFPSPANLPEAPGQESIHPVYFRIFISNHGLCLAALTRESNGGWVSEDNADRFRQLSGDFTGRIIFPQGNILLYYVLSRQEGGLTLESAPPGIAGYTGPLPDPLQGDQVKMVIVYNTIRSASHPLFQDRTLTREQPLKLKLVCVDKEGQDDPNATCEFYNALYKITQPVESDEDESWLYY